MTAIQTGTNLFADHPSHTVAVRDSWSAAWTTVAYLFCDELDVSANPGIDRAVFSFRYGLGLQPGDSEYRLHAPLGASGTYVRVSVPSANILWYGVMLDETDRRDGALILGGEDQTRIPSGRQTLHAVGLEYLLDRMEIGHSIVRGTKTERDAGIDEKFIPRPIVFNDGNECGSNAIRGNATPQENGAEVGFLGTKIFTNYFGPIGFEAADNPETALRFAVEWTARDILEYLFAYKFRDSQVTVSGSDVPFLLFGQLDALEFFTPRLDPRGLSFRDMLNRLIDRRRLLGWRVWVNTATSPETPVVEVFTFAAADVTIDDARTFPKNPTQVTLDFDRSLDIELAEVGLHAAHRFDQVLVRGARRTSTFTIAAEDDTLIQDWTSDQETIYNTAASDADGYDNLKDQQKVQLDAAFRESDRMERVYSWFRLPEVWDHKIDGEPFCPTFVDQSPDSFTTTDAVPIAEAYARFTARLPFWIGVDYTKDAIGLAESGINDLSPPGSHPEKRLPLAMFKIDTQPDRWAQAEKLGVAKDYAFGVRAQEAGPGIVLECNQAGYQHALASADFTGQPTDEPGDINWRETLAATVCLECDPHLEYRLPLDPNTETVRRLVIDVPDARLDWVVPGTVVDIDADGNQVTSDGGLVRDDRQRVEDLAKLAHGWYTAPRHTLRLAYRNVIGLFRPGQLITSIGASQTLQSVNTVVTRVQIDLRRGSTQMETQFAELDVLQF